MAKDRILDVNWEMGYYEVVRFDELTGDLIYKTMFFEPHVDAILEANKRMQDEPELFKNKQKGQPDFWATASIPVAVQMDWLVNDGIDVRKAEHWPAVRKKLNDPDWRHLRTGNFTI